jgi:ribonuclease R
VSARARGRPARLDFPLVGVLRKRGRFLVAEPLFGPTGSRVSVSGGGAGEGDLVMVGSGRDTPAGSRRQGTGGAKVLRKIGRPTVARDVVEGLMLDRGLRRSFPRRVDDEADSVQSEPESVEASRRDLRTLPTFTIDPDDARDFDDAVSAERLDDGSARVWVHIADVSAHVRPGGAIEKEALRRATSVYVPGAVEPMLPEVLSNHACSLRPGEDKLAVTVAMEVSGSEVTKAEFHRSVIRSDKRLTYGEVNAVFAGTSRAEEPWGEPLALAREVAAALAAKRVERGALEVDSTEPSVEFDQEGNVTGVHREAQTESHELIEHLMILANEQVAGYLADRRLPTLYRVHERPDPQAVELMVAQLASLDIPTPPLPRHMSPQQAADLAAECSRLAAAEARRSGRGRASFGSLVLRSLKQAYYSPKNLGHAGLASARYCHFTSPIRRYPDLVAHRALLAGLGLDSAAPRVHELDEVAIECSAREREAMKIERSADDVCMAFVLERELGEAGGGEPPAFEGEIVGLIAKGAFVRFGEEGFEGLLPARRLRDWYELNEEGTALIGQDSGRALRIGDPISVIVDRVDAPRGRVDLEPAA